MRMLSILVLFGALFGCTFRPDPGEGKKIGRIVRLSRQGLFFKTWEGELIRGGFVEGSGSMGTSFHFTIEDPRLLNVANHALETQREVVLHYRIDAISALSRSEDVDPNFATAIEIR